jgi:hypothetical protein
MGIPTKIPHPDEIYIPHLKIYVAGFKTCPFGIEWMRFEVDCKISELVRTVPHIAFEVDNIEEALEGMEVISEISSPSDGCRAAMIIHDGAPVELIEFKNNIYANE